jgi:pimeloyl-ACP methyl ester carboxylesterase
MEALYLSEWQAFLRYHHFPGKEPTVVCLAGLGLAASACYPRVISEPGLATRRTIIVDWLGCGYSDRPDQFSYSLEDHATTIAILLDHLGVKESAVVGHSMGGSVAIELASRRSDLVAQLVLAEANLDAGGGAFSSHTANQTEADFVNGGYQELIQNVHSDGVGGNSSAAIAVGMWQVAAPHALHRSALSLVQGTQLVMRDQLFQLSIPRAYVFGDQSLPDDDYERLPSQGIEVAVVPDAGHGMMWDNPTSFADVLRSILIE